MGLCSSYLQSWRLNTQFGGFKVDPLQLGSPPIPSIIGVRMIRSIGRASRRRAVLLNLGVICIILAGCSQTFRQIAIPLPIATGDPAPLDRALFAATDGLSNPGS